MNPSEAVVGDHPRLSPLLRLEDLRVLFRLRTGILRRQEWIRAVDGVSLEVRSGETLGLVGESGSGKSTLGRAIVRLHEPTEGRILYSGRDISHISGRELRAVRRNLQMVFQDPYTSLDPRQRIGDIIAEPFRLHQPSTPRSDLKKRVGDLLDLVGLPQSLWYRKPYELSGGQSQRVGIARALAMEPRIVVCDEPASSLDVSVQAQILNLLVDLQERLGISYLFISHDLAVVRQVANRIAVMYLGAVMEIGPAQVVSSAPCHPYTQALLSAAPIPDLRAERKRRHIILTGDIPAGGALSVGCRFAGRCWLRKSLDNPRSCTDVTPELTPIPHGSSGQQVACHFPEEAMQARSQFFGGPSNSR